MSTETPLSVRNVWKYPLVSRKIGPINVQIPQGAQILCAYMQKGVVTLWAIVDEQKPVEVRSFWVAGTGEDLPLLKLVYVSTVLDGDYVWHIFELPRK